LIDESVNMAIVVISLINESKESRILFGVEVKSTEVDDMKWRMWMCYAVLMEPFSRLDTKHGKSQA
jgi:hypothetical protein